MKATDKNKATWSEQDLLEIYQSLASESWYLDHTDCCYLADTVYDYFVDECQIFQHDKILPDESKLAKMVEKWMMNEVKSDIREAAKEIASKMIIGMESYADEHQPEAPEAKIKRLAEEYKALQTGFLSKLTPAEQKQLTSLNN